LQQLGYGSQGLLIRTPCLVLSQVLLSAAVGVWARRVLFIAADAQAHSFLARRWASQAVDGRDLLEEDAQHDKMEYGEEWEESGGVPFGHRSREWGQRGTH